MTSRQNNPEKLNVETRRLQPPSAKAETRGAGASLAPGTQPGLPQMVVAMVGTRSYNGTCNRTESRCGSFIKAKQGS